MKKLLLILTLIIALAFVGCSPAPQTSTSPSTSAEPSVSQLPYEQRPAVNIAVLNGPTGMGASKLMKDNADKLTSNKYTFQQFSAPTDVMPLLIKGELDIAALPTNVAATLYNNSQGKVQLLALNTLGVLYVLSKDDSVKTLADLAGKTVYISGQGSTPEYAMNYILSQNGLADSVTLQFEADHATIVGKCAAGQVDVVVLPEPFVSTLLSKNLGFKNCIDLNAEWDKACDGESIFSMGCIVVRSEFAQSNPDVVKSFLNEYSASVQYVNANPEAAAELISEYKIVPDKNLAKSAIPNCNIVCITGDQMKLKTDAYLRLLHSYNPKAVGGSVPGDAFYYIIK